MFDCVENTLLKHVQHNMQDLHARFAASTSNFEDVFGCWATLI